MQFEYFLFKNKLTEYKLRCKKCPLQMWRLFSPQQSLHRSDVNAQCLPDWKGSPWLANQEKLNKRWQKKLANRHRIAATFIFFAGEDPTGWMESLKFRAINSKDLRVPENVLKQDFL